jgi:hypothetical protein
MRVFPKEEIEPIQVDHDIKAQMDDLVGVGVHKVEPENAPTFLREKALGTRGTRASTHHEPDHQGQYYNNNITCAEQIDWTPGNNITYDGSTGDQPYVWVNWSADEENPSYLDYYADHDFYYVSLTETSSSIDFINVTLTADYNTNHSGDRSNQDFGLEMTILTGDYNINDVERNLIKSRRCWHPKWGTGTQAEDLLDSWRNPMNQHYTSAHFCPPYTGDFYIWIKPLNRTSSPSLTPAEVWYNISVRYVLKSGAGAYSVGKNPTSELKNDDQHTVQRPWSGHIDKIGNTPNRDFNMRRWEATTVAAASLPSNVEYVNEMIDYNDWFNFTNEMQYSADPTTVEEVNASIKCYDNFVLGIGSTQVDWLFFSITYIEVWQHDPAVNEYWFTKNWGIGYILFVDGMGNPIDWTEASGRLITNATSDLLYVRTWTDMIFWQRSDGGMYYADDWFDVWDGWGFYNLTKCHVEKHIPVTPPSLAGGGVNPSSGSDKTTYRYNVTYYDVNNDAPTEHSANIDGSLSGHVMTVNPSPSDPLLNDGIYSNGEEYIYDHLFSKNDPKHPNMHEYSFVFKDSDHQASETTGPSSHGPYSGPTVNPEHHVKVQIGYEMPIQVSEDEYNINPYYFNMSYKFIDTVHPYELTYQFSESKTGPWLTSYNWNKFKLDVHPNQTLSLRTYPDMHGEKSFYFNVSCPENGYIITQNPIPIKVKSEPDPPVIISIDHDGYSHSVVDSKANIWVYENEFFNFKVNAFDIDNDSDDLSFRFGLTDTHIDFIGIDIWYNRIDNYNFTGDIYFLPENEHVPYITANITVDDGIYKVWVVVNITVVNANDGPSMIPVTFPSVNQYDYLNRTLSATDPDLEYDNSTEELVFSCNLSDAIPGIVKGIDWDINSKTGYFWFHPVDQAIVGRDPENPDKTFDVEFRVTDRSGAYDTLRQKIKVKNVNDPPEWIEDFEVIIVDAIPETPQIENLTIQVIAPKAYDLDGDIIKYEWDTGDFRPYKQGQVINYTYPEGANYTVRLLYSDGFVTKEVTKVITIIEPGWIPPPEEGDFDGLPDSWEYNYFGNLDQDPDEDFDNDGWTNLEEYQNGWDPTDPDHPTDPPPDLPPDDSRRSIFDILFDILKWFVALVIIIITIIVIIAVWIRIKRQEDEDEEEKKKKKPVSKSDDDDTSWGTSMEEAEVEYVPPPPPWWKGGKDKDSRRRVKGERSEWDFDSGHDDIFAEFYEENFPSQDELYKEHLDSRYDMPREDYYPMGEEASPEDDGEVTMHWDEVEDEEEYDLPQEDDYEDNGDYDEPGGSSGRRTGRFDDVDDDFLD